MECGVGRGRGRSRGGAGGGDELADLRRPHVPHDMTSPGPPQGHEAPPHAQPPHGENKSAAPAPDGEMKGKKTFSLSAEAPEFVPRAFVAAPTPQVQQQLAQQQQLAHQQHLAQHQHQQQPNHQHNLQQLQMVGQPVVPQPQIHYMCHPVLLQVNNLVVQLTMKPNRFDQIARQLTTILSWQVNDAGLMKELVAVIFEQGVGEVNFRYSGARLCQFLIKSVTQSYSGPSFKTILLQRCQEEFEAREVMLQTEPARVCGFTLFLAELFTQLVTGSGQSLEILRSALCKLLTTLLAHPTDTNLKCVAQVLKFTGSTLDGMDRVEMDAVMCSVKDVAMTGPLSFSTRSLLLAVVELRAANWGRGPPSPTNTTSTSPASTPTHSNVPLGTVYYGPDGVIQRVEEEPEDSASDTDDVPQFVPPPYFNNDCRWSPAVEELDGDVAEAFEEFLRLQQQ